MNPFAALQEEVEAYRQAGIVEALLEADVHHDAIVQGLILQHQAEMTDAENRIAKAHAQVTTAISALSASKVVWQQQEAEMEAEISRLRGILDGVRKPHGRHRQEPAE